MLVVVCQPAQPSTPQKEERKESPRLLRLFSFLPRRDPKGVLLLLLLLRQHFLVRGGVPRMDGLKM